MRTSGAMTNRLAVLERAGLVDRVRDQTDGRSVLVRLTPRGKQLVDRILPTYLQTERRLLAALEPIQQAELASTLQTLLLAFEGDHPRSAHSASGKDRGTTNR
jgi:DNA-binding MarR family transcriptional regulator